MSVTRNTIMVLLSGSILVVLSGHMESYSQTSNNNTFADSVNCFVNPCNESNGPLASNIISNQDQNTTTALIGVSFNNITLKEIQDNKEKIKSSLSKYINSTIDILSSGNATTYTYALTPDLLGLRGCTPEDCIIGIIFPPNWPDLE